MDLNVIEKEAALIAREAGTFLRRAVHEIKEVDFKSSAVDLVTQYDHESERLIIRRLQAAFPEHGLVAEEGDYGKAAADTPTWYIDPIDGTNNFAHGLPLFVVSMALYQADEALVGIIYDPLRDELFQATVGGGATLIAGDSEQKALEVSAANELVHSLLATGFPYDRHTNPQNNLAQFSAFLKQAQGLRRSGSAALDLAYVAAGRLDGYWEYRLNTWDVAAGVLLVKEAGGLVTGMDAQPLRMAHPVNLIASNGRIHEAINAVLEEVT